MQKIQLFILHQLLPFVIGILLLAIIFISLLQGGFQFILAVNNGLFMKWERLSNFPTEPVDIITYHQGILVRDTNNTVYALKSFSSLPEREQWVIDTRDLSKPWFSSPPPCTDEELPSSLYSSPPKNVGDCLLFSTGPEMGSSYIVLDPDKQFWIWNNPYSAWSGLFWMIVLCIGAFIGSPILTIVIMKWGIRLLAPQTENDGTQTT